MSSENGKVIRKAGALVQSVRSAVDARQDHLLTDMEPQFSNVRGFLLGNPEPTALQPAGTVFFRLGSKTIEMTASLAALGVEAKYDGTAFFGLLECFDNDLSADTVPWRKNWQTLKKERVAWDGLA